MSWNVLIHLCSPQISCLLSLTKHTPPNLMTPSQAQFLGLSSLRNHCLSLPDTQCLSRILSGFRQEGKNSWKWKSKDSFWIGPIISKKQIFIPAMFSIGRIHNSVVRIEIMSTEYNSWAWGWIQFWWSQPGSPCHPPTSSNGTCHGRSQRISNWSCAWFHPKARRLVSVFGHCSKRMGVGSNETIREQDHYNNAAFLIEELTLGTSLVVQWLGICLLVQGMWVQSPVPELRSHVPWGT